MNDTISASRNLDRIRRYCLAAGLDGLTAKPGLVELAVHDYVNALAEQVGIGDADSLYCYTVPMLSADGSCSVADEMSPVPYDLTGILGGRSDVTTRRLALLERLVERAQEVTGATWLGIYQRRTGVSGVPVLVKVSYMGLPSRAEFPLTPGFARGSTNSTVGLSGRAMVIADVGHHVESGGGYYVCDPKVKSEACLPILGEAGEVIGIVDAEAEARSFFGEERLASLAALCIVLPAVLP
jgi:putative methionine-R-sulfoxide reductase with GAF domain